MSCLISIHSHKIRNKSSKLTNCFIGHFYFIYSFYTGTEKLLEIVVHHFKREVQYIVIITIMVWFISLILYLLLTIGFQFLDLFPTQNIRKNTEEASFGIPGASTEPKNDLKFNPIVESEIVFLLEIDVYSWD